MPGKRVLLLDTAFSALPIYAHLASLDLDLFVMGGRPDDVLARQAGARWIEQDYSRTDAVKDWLSANRCDIVVPGCTDVSLTVAAAVSVSPFIDSPETIDVFGDKTKFRALCRELGLPSPASVAPSHFPASGTFIAKPADSFSGRGITVFDGSDAEATASALTMARETSPTGNTVIEECIEGQLYSYSVFLADRRATTGFFVKEGSSANRFAVDTSFVVRDMPERIAADFACYAGLIAERLSLGDGLLHIQFILRGDEPFLIEATRRCPGDLYSLLIEFSTGYPYAARYAASFLGERLDADGGASRFIVRHTVTSSRQSINSGLRFTAPANVRAFFPLQRVGETLLPNQKARSGVLFVEAPSQEQASDAYDAFLARSVYAD